jgi:hypothetical protein
MRVSYSTLAMLDQAGDEAAHTLLVAWNGMCGIIWETDFLQAHYRGKGDYLVMRSTLPYDKQQVFAPYRLFEPSPEASKWNLVPEHPITQDMWYQKAR